VIPARVAAGFESRHNHHWGGIHGVSLQCIEQPQWYNLLSASLTHQDTGEQKRQFPQQLTFSTPPNTTVGPMSQIKYFTFFLIMYPTPATAAGAPLVPSSCNCSYSTSLHATVASRWQLLPAPLPHTCAWSASRHGHPTGHQLCPLASSVCAKTSATYMLCPVSWRVVLCRCALAPAWPRRLRRRPCRFVVTPPCAQLSAVTTGLA
jgi:hypothetical protein